MINFLTKTKYILQLILYRSVCLLFVTLFSFFTYAEIVQCEDNVGNTIFTDNTSLCKNSKNSIVDVTVQHSCGKKAANKHNVNYCSPRRDYKKVSTTWNIFVEQSLVNGDKALAQKAVNKLDKNLSEIFSLLPKKSIPKLKNINFYLMWGKQSPDGGRTSSMGYFRKGQPKNYHYLDPRWQHSVVVYSAKNLMYLNDMWTKKALMHEISHAWHIVNFPQRHPPIYNAYLHAKDKDLYHNVEDYKGRKIEKAYALKNQMEYFAELSAMYFVGGNYFPYKDKDLKTYDLEGYVMIQNLWGI